MILDKYFDHKSHSGCCRCPPEIEGEIQESDLRRESVSRRIDGSVGGRLYDIDQPLEETPTLLKRTSQCVKGGKSLDPGELVLRASL